MQRKDHRRGIQQKYFSVIKKSEMLSHYLSLEAARQLSINAWWHMAFKTKGVKKKKKRAFK